MLPEMRLPTSSEAADDSEATESNSLALSISFGTGVFAAEVGNLRQQCDSRLGSMVRDGPATWTALPSAEFCEFWSYPLHSASISRALRCRARCLSWDGTWK